MRIPDRALHSVLFLGVTRPDASDSLIGTAFVVVVPWQRRPGAYHGHLVTAAHCLDSVLGEDLWALVPSESGPPRKTPIPEASRWTRHPLGKGADVAVVPISGDVRPVQGIPMDWFVADAELRGEGIGIGDEVHFIGLFSGVDQSAALEPIARMGNIAMLPIQPVPIKERVSMQAYVIEARSFGGLSGCPVFVRQTLIWDMTPLSGGDKPGPHILRGTGQTRFLGVMHGHWHVDESDPNAVRLYKAPEGSPGLNLGLAIVTPAFRIRETIDLPQLAALREHVEENWEKRNPPAVVADTADHHTDRASEDHLTKESFEQALKKASRRVGPKTR